MPQVIAAKVPINLVALIISFHIHLNQALIPLNILLEVVPDIFFIAAFILFISAVVFLDSSQSSSTPVSVFFIEVFIEDTFLTILFIEVHKFANSALKASSDFSAP